MNPAAPPSVTELLKAWNAGDERALDSLVPLVYEELRRRAQQRIEKERAGHTLNPTALVHEVYLRLAGQQKVSWRNRAQFLAVASQIMRRILVDHARARQAGKRGAGLNVTLDDSAAATSPRDVEILALDEALVELTGLDATQGRVVELRYFGGLSLEEVGAVLGVSLASVKREWVVARAWLHQRLTSP